jgi:hypothetical protein
MCPDNRSFNQNNYGRWCLLTTKALTKLIIGGDGCLPIDAIGWLYIFSWKLNWRLFYDEVTISSQWLFIFDQMTYDVDLFIDQPFFVEKKSYWNQVIFYLNNPILIFKFLLLLHIMLIFCDSYLIFLAMI